MEMTTFDVEVQQWMIS